MKYAILSLGGALGMGLSAIADSMQGYSFGETLSIVGCIVMIIGLVGVVFPGLSRWWNKDYGNE